MSEIVYKIADLCLKVVQPIHGAFRVASMGGAAMSDWDFLHEMNERGYSPEEIADAAGSGAALN